MPSSKNYLAVFGLLFGAACWGVIWYPYRLMQEAGVSGVTSSFYTYAIATGLGCLLFISRSKNAFKLTASVLALAIVAGWTNLSYVLAIIDGEVMRVMLLFYLSPIWTLLLAYFWLKEPVGRQGIAIVIISLMGALIMLWQPDGLPVPSNTSEWLALSAGIGFSLTNVLTRRSVSMSFAAKCMAVWVGVMGMSLCVMLLQPHENASLNLPALSASSWLIMGLIALLLMAATMFVQYGVTHIPATRASVLFLFELVVAAVASYYLADEVMSLNDWLGGALIVSAALYAAVVEGQTHQAMQGVAC